MVDISDPEMLEATSTPDVDYLQQAFNDTQNDLSEWLDRRQRDWNVRNCHWSNKSSDFRKHVPNGTTGQVFPWDGSSDQEVRLADELIGCRVATCMNAVRRAHIVATPVESDDVDRASATSAFLRWLINTRIDDFYDQVELSLNHLFEKGMCVTYVYWDSRDQKQQQSIKLEEIAQAIPQIAEAIMDGSMDEELVALLNDQFKVSKKKAKGMLRELREAGETTVPIVRQTINQPRIKALAPDEDVFFPAYTIDPQEAPYCFHVVHMTPQQLHSKVASEDWDEEWVEAAIASNARGKDESGNSWRLRDGMEFTKDEDQTISVIYCYQKLLDEDHVEGVYCTVFADGVGGGLYAKHSLLDYG